MEISVHTGNINDAYCYITYEVDIIVGCIMTLTCQKVESICQFGIMDVWLILALWQPYLLSGISNVFTVTHTTHTKCIHTYTYILIYVWLCIYLHIYIYACMHTYMSTCIYA